MSIGLAHEPTPPRSARHDDTLTRLLSRRSAWPLEAPAPTAVELSQVFAAAVCAPDHGQLRPWRFIVIDGDARHALGEAFAQSALLRDPQADPGRFRQKALAAPLVIAVAAQIVPEHKVPEIEQLCAVAAATMNMLNALHLLGYGGFWGTGAVTYDRLVHDALGLDAGQRLLGFVHVGTPRMPARTPARPDAAQFVRRWQGDGGARG